MEITSRDFLSELHRTAFWQPNVLRSSVERLVEYILTGQTGNGPDPETAALAEQALQFDFSRIRVVVIGGGTGLSTVVGGNSYLPAWPEHSNAGIKREFRHLTSIVCTTDDGGSTGALLQALPMIAVGDLRKLMLSSILPLNLQKTYGLNVKESYALLRVIHAVFNHRASRGTAGFRELRDPLKIVPKEMRSACPESLACAFREMGAYLAPGGGLTIHPERHAMGNLFLTAAIFREAGGDGSAPPGLREIQCGIDYVASLIGAPAGTIHTATSTPGQLKFRYANGVEVLGQRKSAYYRRSAPVDRLTAVYACKPDVSPAVKKALREADLIIYAPGSLYSSILPVLQIEPVVAAIRGNRRALKILGANTWIQEGETDISLKNEGRGFLVSELIEACDRNIPGGITGLIDVVLCANLEQVPASILRNHALEGKHPIHLDKTGVESLGVHPVEATLFSWEQQAKTQLIQHNPQRFAIAVKTLLYADRHLRDEQDCKLHAHNDGGKNNGSAAVKTSAVKYVRQPFLCEHLRSVRNALRDKKFQPEALKEILIRAAWEHRDIRPEHFAFFRGVRLLTTDQWERSTEWDNVLGYFDPQDRYVKLHQSLLSQPRRLEEEILIALGESLLGRYIDDRRWVPLSGARCYEILLRSEAKRECYLSNRQLHAYLQLARMIPDPENDLVYRITVNQNEGFFPPGLLFGLIYSWYLTGRGLAAEYEMTLLRWPEKVLNPLHVRDRMRKESLITF
ncbi:MAG: YvcK family protein, partial [Acidobacteria bacterium]|nr:YvcK family protein [Acidobacteriota bacterium]